MNCFTPFSPCLLKSPLDAFFLPFTGLPNYKILETVYIFVLPVFSIATENSICKLTHESTWWEDGTVGTGFATWLHLCVFHQEDHVKSIVFTGKYGMLHWKIGIDHWDCSLVQVENPFNRTTVLELKETAATPVHVSLIRAIQLYSYNAHSILHSFQWQSSSLVAMLLMSNPTVGEKNNFTTRQVGHVSFSFFRHSRLHLHFIYNVDNQRSKNSL